MLLATNRETLPMDPAAIQEKYGVAPPQLIEVKSLMGDASDNIPGVPGIGEKTALALVQKFGSLQGVYEHLDDKAIKPKQREKLEANKELAELSHMLGTIRKDAPIETAPEHYCRTAGDPAAAAQLLAELEMHKLTARWGLDESPAAVAASAETLPEVQPDLLPLAPEGRYDLAQNKDGSWYAVQGIPFTCWITTACPLCWMPPGCSCVCLMQSRCTTLHWSMAALARPLCLMASWPPTY